jgi:thioredoxin 1
VWRERAREETLDTRKPTNNTNAFMTRKLANRVGGVIGGNSQFASAIHLDESNFDQTISESPVPVLVDFWASWCGPCRMIAPVLDEIAKEQGESVKIVKVNVDNSLALSNRFGIRNVPTLLFFKGGEVKDQVVGVTSKAELISRLKTLK